jgi:hypothetical protein
MHPSSRERLSQNFSVPCLSFALEPNLSIFSENITKTGIKTLSVSSVFAFLESTISDGFWDHLDPDKSEPAAINHSRIQRVTICMHASLAITNGSTKANAGAWTPHGSRFWLPPFIQT